MSLNRRLAAIMFTDMVGFTALMQQDEALGLKKRKRHKEVFESQHQRYGGDIVQYFGDGTLSIFSNSSDAIQCAIEIQKSLREPVEVPLRIGIHAGQAIIEDDGIIGDAINIASRIESFANSGGVLVSDSVYDQVRNQTQWEFVSLGKFSLKNIERPFEIYAVASDGLAVPPTDYLQGKGEIIAPLKTDVPEPSDLLIGREQELKDLVALIHENKVVTITGTGGVGKTRLLLDLCKVLGNEFKDGIAYVSMATLSDAKTLIPTLASALDIKEAPGRDQLDGITALISAKKGLIVLDNLEQVTHAGKEIAALVAGCPNLKILCTSRTPLKIKSEIEYPLYPLSIPDSDSLKKVSEYPSVQLFVKRAMQVNREFRLTEENATSVVSICRRVDGLPLAIELAAARTRILSPEKLLTRLSRSLDILTSGSNDLPERHQTLRSTIEWSYSLLNDSEKRLFRRLGVFTGGFTLEAIEAVCYTRDEERMLAIDELESLIDKGLIVNKRIGSRFNLLQTIQDFGLEKLREFGEETAQRSSHANYYATLAVTLDAATQGVDQPYWMRQGPLEEANIVAALDFLLDEASKGELEAQEKGLSICGDLWMYWHIKGKHNTAKRYVLAFLDASPKDVSPSKARVKAILALNISLNLLAEFELGREYVLQGLEMANEIEDETEIARAAFMAAFGLMPFDLEKALAYSDDCLSRFKALRHEYWLGFSLWQRGVLLMVAGKPSEAKAHFAEAIPKFLKLNENEGKGCALSGLALTEMIEGNFDKSIELYEQSLLAFKAVGDRPEEARLYNELAWHFIIKRNTYLGKKYALESIQAHQEVGSMRGVGATMFCFSAIEAIENNPIAAVEIAAAAQSFADQEGVVVENGFGFNNQGKVFLDSAKSQLSVADIEKAEATGAQLTLKQVLELIDNRLIAVA